MAGLLERRRALQPADAVVGERALERGDEALGQALGGGVERAQERVQVLLRAAQHLVGVAGRRAAERPHVGVQLEQAVLALGVDRRVEHVDAGHVVAEHQPLQPLELARVGLGGLEGQALARLPRRVLERVDLEQRPAGGDVHVAADQHLAHAAVDRRGERGLHLHALGDGDDVAGLDLVAGRHGDRHHDAGRVGADQAALVARDAVRHAVDLDEQVDVLHGGQRPVGTAAEAEPALVLGQLLDLGLDHRAVDLDAVAPRAGLPDREAVADTAVEQVERVADVGLGLRAAAARERVEVRAVGSRLLVAQRDRRLHERGVGMADGLDVTLRLQPVEPAGVDLARPQLGPAQQLEQEALVGGPLVDHHHRVGDGAAQARDRLLARGAVGDDLGQHRVEVGGHGVALGEAGVDADAGAGGEPEEADAAGRGEKPRAGSSALRRTSMAWPLDGGGSPSSRPPAATCSWSATRSAPVTTSVTGCSTWRRALTSMNENCSDSGS